MTPNTPAGGAVAWRAVAKEGGRCPQLSWCPIPVSAWALADEQEGLCTIEYAYTTPPATVSVEAVLALVGRWRAEVERGTGYLNDESDRAVLSCADELEALTEKANG